MSNFFKSSWFIGIIVAVLFAFVYYAHQKSNEEIRSISLDGSRGESKSTKLSKKEFKKIADQKIAEAESSSYDDLKKHKQEFESFISSRKVGVRAFAENVTGWYSKWRVVKEWLPFADHDGHRKYIQEEFDKAIFTQKELKDILELSIQSSLKDIDKNENQLAIDLEILIQNSTFTKDQTEKLKKDFNNITERLITANHWDLGGKAANIVLSEIATIVAFEVLEGMGIIATGGLSSWGTLGVGLVVGVIVDAIWDYFTDPTGKLEAVVEKQLDEISKKLSDGLDKEISEIIKQRSDLWKQNVIEIMQ